MNSFSCSGKVIKVTEPLLLNEGKTVALRFTVVAVNGQLDLSGKPRVDFIPCIIFNPDDEVQEIFSRDKLGFIVEFSGKIATTNLTSNGKKSFRTEAVVYPKSLHMLKD